MAKGPMALWLLDGGAQLLDVPHYIGPWFCESFPAKPFGGQWWILFGEVHFDGPWSDGFVGIVQRSGTGWQCGKCLELLGKSGRINLPPLLNRGAGGSMTIPDTNFHSLSFDL